MTDSPHSREIAAERLSLRNQDHVRMLLAAIGTHPGGIRIMAPKAGFFTVLVRRLSPYHANVLKQEMLSLGADAATAAGCIKAACEQTDVLLMGTLRHMTALAAKLEIQPPSFAPVRQALLDALKYPEFGPPPLEWKVRGRVLQCGLRPLLMGIVNVTPDSFSDGGNFLDPDAAADHALSMAAAGADILDIGGESSRPGSLPVPPDEQIRRIIPVIERIRVKSDIPLSVDTSSALVAREAVAGGANIVNDITALGGDPRMASFCAECGAGVVLMHMKGDPLTMQDNPSYENVTGEVTAFLKERMGIALEAGVPFDSIACDPGIGIGFGKSLEHNLELMNGISLMSGILNRPVLIGPSRKRFLGELTGRAVGDRLAGTMGSVVACALLGAGIIRVHDVKAARDALNVALAVMNHKPPKPDEED